MNGGGWKFQNVFVFRNWHTDALWAALADRMNNLTFDGAWEVFKPQFYQVGAELLGFVKKHDKDWFDDNIKGFYSKSNTLHLSELSSSSENEIL